MLRTCRGGAALRDDTGELGFLTMLDRPLYEVEGKVQGFPRGRPAGSGFAVPEDVPGTVTGLDANKSHGMKSVNEPRRRFHLTGKAGVGSVRTSGMGACSISFG